jgi:hypothetical protein
MSRHPCTGQVGGRRAANVEGHTHADIKELVPLENTTTHKLKDLADKLGPPCREHRLPRLEEALAVYCSNGAHCLGMVLWEEDLDRPPLGWLDEVYGRGR